MEENVMMNEVIDDVMTVVEVPEVQGGKGLGAWIGLGLITIAGGIGAWAYKNRAKFEARSIKNLEKKGYVVVKVEDLKKNVDDVEPIE